MAEGTDTQERTDARLDNGDGEDRERFTHIVNKRVTDPTEAMLNGTPVVAFCGKVWVPSRDPKRYPLCPTCKEIVEGLGLTVPSL